MLKKLYGKFVAMQRRRGHANYLNLIKQERNRVVTLSVRQLLQQIDGDIAEFGVRTGDFAFIECRELATWQADRTIHLFDSWEGYGTPTIIDRRSKEVQQGRFTGQPAAQIPPTELQRRLSKVYPNIKLYVGFFDKTLLSFRVKLGMVVMDCDLYSSSLTVLQQLFKYNLLSDGAIILFNSWNGNGACDSTGIRGAWKKIQEAFQIDYSVVDFFGWSGQKIIVHSYKPKTGAA